MISETASALNKALKDNNLSKEYFSIKKALLEDDEVNKLLEEITLTQKKLQQSIKDNDTKVYKELKNKLEELKKEFIEHPLINNYLIVKNELKDLIEQVINIISVD